MSVFANKTGIKLWANKPIDLTVLSCPHCTQEMPSHKNIETFLNYLYARYSTRYVAEKGEIVWDESRQLEEFEELLEDQTGVFVSEFSPLPLFLTHDFDYASYPEYRKDGLYLIAFIQAYYEMPDTLRYIEHLKELFETVQWYTEYLYKHYEEGYDFWYELVDQNGKEIILLQGICYAYL